MEYKIQNLRLGPDAKPTNKDYRVIREGVEVFNTDNKHDAVSYVMKYCGTTFEAALESGIWTLKRNGKVINESFKKKGEK